MPRVLVALLFFASPLLARPNVVLIVIDDLGQTDLGCYGSKFHKTPHLDAFAKSGVKITDAYSACPVCSPTRAAILTGKHPARLNITDWLPGRPDLPAHRVKRPVIRQELPLEEVTLAEELKKAGYATAHVGKWHLGGKGFEPTQQGFDVNIAGDDTGTPLSYFAPFQNKMGTRKMPGLEDAKEGEYLTDRLTTEAEKFITANKDKPFFLYLAHYAVHTPLTAKKEMIEKYKPGPLGRQSNPTYAAMVESMDESVGRILKTLDDLKLADNTVVIFTSDNGGLATMEGAVNGIPATFNSPYREGKGFLYEGGVRVPFILRGPGIKASVPFISTDVTPTVLGLCGVKSEVTFDGRNLTAALGGADAKPPAEFYWHYPHYANQGSRPGAAIRDGNWKYIEYYDSERRELFDLSKDVSESRNLVADKPDVVKTLAKKLDDWRAAVGAKMPTPNPAYKPNPQAKDGTITLKGEFGDAHGVMLRFEPLPHKNTFGFWVNKDDYLTWEFEVTTPGTFAVELMQGCGKGSGGAEVELSVGESKTTHTVKDTGGFQAFEKLAAGTLKIEKAGRHTLTVKAKTKPGVAVMDLRQVVLTPTK
ncbi:MAG: sulfatase-like hydrolase/transferase [Fimbriiglobus sp.]|nr:sulfatase-like hydrolase/transferase [Fimbriiglobus sp.]